jgi:hypothetical protein
MWSQSLCSHRLWSHRLLLASLTNPVPLVVSTTDLSVSEMGTTARLLGHTTGRFLINITGHPLSRFPVMSNTTGPTGRPQMMLANTTRHQVAPNTSHLTRRLSATGRLPARVERVRSERPFGRWSEKRQPTLLGLLLLAYLAFRQIVIVSCFRPAVGIR